MKINKGFEAQQVVDKIQHDLMHSETLLKLYPDLTVVIKNTGDSIHEIEYYSSIIANQIDQCDFVKENPSSYFYIHAVYPYKNVKIDCAKCEGIIRVNSNPHRVPLFMEHETSFRKEYTISCFVYEDLFKLHNFSNHVLAESQLYILSKLDEHSKNNNKTDILVLSSSIKMLLPFT